MPILSAIRDTACCPETQQQRDFLRDYARDSKVTEEDIAKSFEPKQPLTLKKGSSIMLIQSGAMFPDDPVVKALEKHYTVPSNVGRRLSWHAPSLERRVLASV